jgi:hypothetical protein
LIAAGYTARAYSERLFVRRILSFFCFKPCTYAMNIA